MKITHESVWANVAENVCSLETSKKLWEADIRLVNSICAWVSHHENYLGDVYSEYQLNYFFPECVLNAVYEEKDIGFKAYPAPSGDDIERFITMNYKEYSIELHSHYSDGKIMMELVMPVYLKSKWYSNRAEALAEIALAKFAKVRLKNEFNRSRLYVFSI